jgi:hypothetical protein
LGWCRSGSGGRRCGKPRGTRPELDPHRQTRALDAQLHVEKAIDADQHRRRRQSKVFRLQALGDRFDQVVRPAGSFWHSLGTGRQSRPWGPSSSRIRRALAHREGDSAGGGPPTLPRLRAASRPSRVHPAIRPRSNSETVAKTWDTSRPAGVVVSMSSASERKPAPLASIVFTISRRSLGERASLWYLVTTTTSLGRSWSRRRSSSAPCR